MLAKQWADSVLLGVSALASSFPLAKGSLLNDGAGCGVKRLRDTRRWFGRAAVSGRYSEILGMGGSINRQNRQNAPFVYNFGFLAHFLH